MTRINSHIEVQDLTNKHLFAEYREIIRIPNVVLKNIEKTKSRVLPINFKLGTGHVLYFYNKNKYLHERFLAIINELKIRNYNNLSISDESFIKVKYEAPILYNDISIEEKKYNASIVVHRILERCKDKKIVINNKEYTYPMYEDLMRKYF